MAEAGVVTNNEATTTVKAIVDSQPKEGKEPSRITVVTNDNINEYVNEKLGIDPVEEGKKELEKVEKEKAEKKAAAEAPDVEGEEGVSEHLPKDKKGKLNERFSELTKARKEAEAKAAKIEAEAQTLRQAKVKAEEEAQALKAKYEPVKTEQDPEPQPSQFTDVTEYSKALKEWTADNTRREDAKKAEAERYTKEREDVAKAWSERQEAARKKIADYDKTISDSTVKVSDQVRDAIVESEHGPQLLHHLASNPEVAEKIGKMSVARALTEIGRLEVQISGGAAKEKVAEPNKPVAEISKAPSPISPLKGADAPVLRLSGTDAVPASMTYEDWKALRKAGKIK